MLAPNSRRRSRRRHDVVERLGEGGVAAPEVEGDRELTDLRGGRAGARVQLRHRAPGRGVRIADQPWRQPDRHVLDVLGRRAAGLLSERHAGDHLVGVRTGLRVERPVLVGQRVGEAA